MTDKPENVKTEPAKNQKPAKKKRTPLGLLIRRYYAVWIVAGVFVAISSVLTIYKYISDWQAAEEENSKIESSAGENGPRAASPSEKTEKPAPPDITKELANIIAKRDWPDIQAYMLAEPAARETLKANPAIENSLARKLSAYYDRLYKSLDKKETEEVVLNGFVRNDIFATQKYADYYSELNMLLKDCILTNRMSKYYRFRHKLERSPIPGEKTARAIWSVRPKKLYVKISDGLMEPSGGFDPRPAVVLRYVSLKKDVEKIYTTTWEEIKDGFEVPVSEIEPFFIDSDAKEITVELWDYNYSDEKKDSMGFNAVSASKGKSESDDRTIEWEFEVE